MESYHSNKAKSHILRLKTKKDKLNIEWGKLRQSLQKIRTNHDKLTAAGEEIDTNEYVLHVARLMPTGQTAVRTALLTQTFDTINDMESFLLNLHDVDIVSGTETEEHATALQTQARNTNDNNQCFYCGKRGHMKRECRSFQKDKQNGNLHPDKGGNRGCGRNNGRSNRNRSHATSNTQETHSFHTSVEEIKQSEALTATTINTKYIADSGATDHMVNDTSLFTTTHSVTPRILTASTGEQHTVNTAGTIRLTPTITLTNVLYCPDLKANLISLNKIVDKGATINMTKNTLRIQKGRDTLLTITRDAEARLFTYVAK